MDLPVCHSFAVLSYLSVISFLSVSRHYFLGKAVVRVPTAVISRVFFLSLHADRHRPIPPGSVFLSSWSFPSDLFSVFPAVYPVIDCIPDQAEEPVLS